MQRLSGLPILVLLYVTAVQAGDVLPGPLVEPSWLAQHLTAVQVLDVRVDYAGFAERPPKTRGIALGYGHIPGALWIDFQQVRRPRVIEGREVQAMVPTAAAFQQLMQQAGVRHDRPLVIVSAGLDGADMTMAARLYWQLKYFGHEQLAILNGGLAQWTLEGRPLSYQAAPPARGDWRARPVRRDLLADSNEVAAGKAQLLDNRSIGLYLGTWKKDYVSAAGHIPGARWLPDELMTTAGPPARFLPVAQLRSLAQELGVAAQGPTIAYCNSGHLAAGGWFILRELLGNPDVKLYDGSMHQWTLEQRPVTRGKME